MDYKTVYDKIIQTYYRDEIKPMDPEFCFCGTIADGAGWYVGDVNYSLNEYEQMEHALFVGIKEIDGRYWSVRDELENYPNMTESGIFNGMVKALEVLRGIHISRGEKIDEEVTFKKRELQL